MWRWSFKIYGWSELSDWAGRTEKAWNRRAVGQHLRVCGQRNWHSHFNALPPPCGRAETLQLRLIFFLKIYILLWNKHETISACLMFTNISVMLVSCKLTLKAQRRRDDSHSSLLVCRYEQKSHYLRIPEFQLLTNKRQKYLSLVISLWPHVTPLQWAVTVKPCLCLGS